MANALVSTSARTTRIHLAKGTCSGKRRLTFAMTHAVTMEVRMRFFMTLYISWLLIMGLIVGFLVFPLPHVPFLNAVCAETVDAICLGAVESGLHKAIMMLMPVLLPLLLTAWMIMMLLVTLCLLIGVPIIIRSMAPLFSHGLACLGRRMAQMGAPRIVWKGLMLPLAAFPCLGPLTARRM